MQNTCNELKNAKAMWIPLSGDTMVPTPKDQVSPNKGVKIITHLAMTASVCFSSAGGESPTPLRSSLKRTTSKIKMLIKTIVKAGITKASRAFVSFHFSQQTSLFLTYPFPGAVTATVTTAIIRGQP